MTSFEIVKGRTGEVRVEPGFWWVQRKRDGSWTVVQVADNLFGELGVMFIGNLNWPSIEEASEDIEFMLPIPQP